MKQMKARRGYQGREFFDQLQRIEHEMRRAIASGKGKLVQKLALRAVRQSFKGQGRTQQAATETGNSPGCSMPRGRADGD
jgi:hypothetical protein